MKVQECGQTGKRHTKGPWIHHCKQHKPNWIIKTSLDRAVKETTVTFLKNKYNPSEL